MRVRICYMAVPVSRLFFIYILLQLSFEVASQTTTIDLDLREVPLSNALIEIAIQGDLDLIIRTDDIEDRIVTLRRENISISEAIEAALQGTNYEFVINEGQLFLFKFKRFYGYVKDKNSGEPLLNAVVRHEESSRVVFTNNYGFFSLQLPEIKGQIQISYLGYKKIEYDISAISDEAVSINMEPSLSLQEVIVVQESFEKLNNRRGSSTDILSNNLSTVFAVGGVTDLYQYLYSKSGSQTGPDGVGGLHVRGGKVDQNLVLYDGVEIFNPSHSLGLFSVFNPEQISRSTFYKSGFQSRHAGRLSSVVDIRMKEGDLDEWGLVSSVSTVASSISFDGPIKKEKTGISLSLRRTHLDPIIKSRTRSSKLSNDEVGQTNHFFYDVNAKLHHVIDIKNRLYVTYFRSRDAYNDESSYQYDAIDGIGDYTARYKLDWGNEMLAVRWNHLHGNKLFSNTTFYHTRFDYSSFSAEQDIIEETDEFLGSRISSGYGFLSSINESGIRYDADLYMRDSEFIRVGAGIKRRSIAPGIINYIDEVTETLNEVENVVETQAESFIDNNYNNYESYVYGDVDFSLSYKLKARAGMRGTIFLGTNTVDDISSLHNYISGGLQLEYLISENWKLSGSYDHTVQPLHLLTSSDIGFPNDLWVPSTDLINPQKGDQLDLSLFFQYEDTWFVSLSGYYKNMNDILRFRDNISLPSLSDNYATFWESDVSVGSGEAIGVDIDINLRTPLFRADVAYSHARSFRRFDDILSGNRFPYQFDQPHRFSLNLHAKLSRALWLYSNFSYGSGVVQTLYTTDDRFSPLSVYNISDSVHAGETNGDRLEPFHRLDVGIVCGWGDSVEKKLIIGLQNVYDRSNVYYAYQLENSILGEPDGRQRKGSLPLLPTLRFSISMN